MVLTKTILPKKFKPPGGEGPVDPRIARAAAKEERQERRNRRRHPETFSNNQIKLFFVLCDIKILLQYGFLNSFFTITSTFLAVNLEISPLLLCMLSKKRRSAKIGCDQRLVRPMCNLSPNS